jgi:hypothetical protein
MRIRVRLGVLVAVLPSLLAQPAGGQPVMHWWEATAGSQVEEYLRVLQGAGKVQPYPMSLRGLALAEIEMLARTDSAHPWRAALEERGGSPSPFRIRRPELSVMFNSARPAGFNDGAVWAGRGMTASLQGGAIYQAGVLTVIAHPILFWSQNAAFPLIDTGHQDGRRFAHGRYGGAIDLPQRFGDGAYHRLDPGQSVVRLDLRGFATGISSENEVWGPATDLPLILGSNAPGIPRFFAGTSRPQAIWIGRLHTRMFIGQLAQSSFSPADPDRSRRLASGLVMVFTPRNFEVLEIGGARFFHRRWPEGGPGVREFLSPLGSFVKGLGSPLDTLADNEVSSLFFRLAVPGAAEVYGEFAKDDGSFAAHRGVVLRELVTHPDHNSSYLLGFRKVWSGAPRATAIRLELMNSRLSHLNRVHPQTPMYLHTQLAQGHTHRGQLLGAALGFGGAALVATVDSYHARGRWFARLIRDQAGADQTGVQRPDVVYSAFAGGSRFFRGWEGSMEVGLSAPVDGSAAMDAGGVHLRLGARPSVRWRTSPARMPGG